MPTRTYATGSSAYAIAAADINHDGKIDLVTGSDSRRDFAVLLGTGAGRFGVAQRYSGPGVTGIALGDLDGDGNLDAVGAASSVVVRLGRGRDVRARAARWAPPRSLRRHSRRSQRRRRARRGRCQLRRSQRLCPSGRRRRNLRHGHAIPDGREPLRG